MPTGAPSVSFAAIVVMAGSGTRFGGDLPKVFVPLAGEPMWMHSVRALSAVPGLVSLVLVTGADRIDEVRAACHTVDPTEVALVDVAVVAGGAERQDSVRAGLAAVSGRPDVVAVHDAARPLIRPATIEQAVRTAGAHGSGLVAVPARDTIKEVDGGVVTATPDRARLWRAQTPQCFRTELLLSAHEHAARSGVLLTDDAAAMEHAGHPVHVVRGDAWNIKVTEPGDLAIAEAVLAARRPEEQE